jgi:hypothetical protein
MRRFDTALRFFGRSFEKGQLVRSEMDGFRGSNLFQRIYEPKGNSTDQFHTSITSYLAHFHIFTRS